MLSGFNTSKPINYVEIFPENLHNNQFTQGNLLEKSEIHSQHLINYERFAELNSFSLKNFTFVCDPEERCPAIGFSDRDYDNSYLEDPLYNVLSLKRGKSECYLEDPSEIGQAYQYFIEEPTAINSNDASQHKNSNERYFSNQMSLHYLPSYEESEGQSKNLISTSYEANDMQMEPKEPLSTQSKVSTKNVTKNMGKLLFKFIWKNRITLKKYFKVQNAQWQCFLVQIRSWKKENNITRQFLNSRWHTNGTNSKLFRMISHHFFKKRCLSAIFESKIEWKQMHIKRLKRFQDATSNPKALDNLN